MPNMYSHFKQDKTYLEFIHLIRQFCQVIAKTEKPVRIIGITGRSRRAISDSNASEVEKAVTFLTSRFTDSQMIVTGSVFWGTKNVKAFIPI